MASYAHKIVEKNISHWTFSKGLKGTDFGELYPQMKQTFDVPEVTRLVTVIELDDVTDEDILQFWFNIGEAATEGKIEKWGVVVPPLDLMKKMTFERLVSGGGKPREYEVKYDPSEEVILEWCKA